MLKDHIIRNCRSKRNCFNCRLPNHHIAICTKYITKKIERKEQASNVINSSTSVLLQTASGIVADTSEKRSRPVKILLDAGSQRSYISERIVKQLKLVPKGSQNVIINTFGSTEGKSALLKEYSFCVKNEKKKCNLYLTGFAVPFICSPLTDQRIEVVEDIFPILKNLDLSDISRNDRDIDLLIGADYYWCVVEGETKRCGTEGLVAINSKLGWLLSGPYEWNNQDSAAVNLATTHVLSIEFNEEQEEALLSSEIEKFWNLDTVGIKHNETSVYERIMDEVKFKEGRYEVRLPFKEDHPLIEDQYASTLTRLKRLKTKLRGVNHSKKSRTLK